jgi:hypothetical protein
LVFANYSSAYATTISSLGLDATTAGVFMGFALSNGQTF